MAGRPTEFSKIYNEEIKNRFLNSKDYTRQSKVLYKKRFARFYEYEITLGKDLYDFNNPEIEDMLVAISSKTHVGLSNITSIISSYKEWAIREGYSKDTINMVKLINTDKLQNMINKTAFRKQYINGIDELREIVDFCENKQDALPYILLFFSIRKSVRGKEFDELITLKTSDCDFVNCEIHLSNRTVSIPEEFMRVIHWASQESEYKVFGKPRNKEPLELKDVPYLFKSAMPRNKEAVEGDIASPATVNNRIKRIAKEYGKPLLNATNVFYSGIFYRLSEIEKIRPLENKDYQDIRSEYNLIDASNAPATKKLYEQYKEAMKAQNLLEKIEEQEEREQEKQNIDKE